MVAYIEVWDASRRVFKQRQQGGDAAILARKEVGIDSSWLGSLQAPDAAVNTWCSMGCMLFSCMQTGQHGWPLFGVVGLCTGFKRHHT